MEIIRKIMECKNSAYYREIFFDVLFTEISTDEEPFSKKGYTIMRSILRNDMNDLFISLCGWSIDSILKLSHILPDENNEFPHEEAEIAINFRDGTEVSAPCEVDFTTLHIYNVEFSDSALKIIEENEVMEKTVTIGDTTFPIETKDFHEANGFGFWMDA